jgi:hypothetical protein
MIRYIGVLLRRFGERRHGLNRELTGCGQRRIPRICLVEPGLRRAAPSTPASSARASPRKNRCQRRRGDPRDDGAAVVPAASVRSMRTALRRPCRRSTMPVPVVEISGAGGRFHQRQQFTAQTGGVQH